MQAMPGTALLRGLNFCERNLMTTRLIRACGSAFIFLGILAPGASAFPMARQKSRGFILVNKGKAKAAIVIPATGSPADRRAAEILQSSVRKMSGVSLPIFEKRRPGSHAEIAIGFAGDKLPKAVSSSATSLKEDGFLVASSGRNVYILSGGHKGSVYGVVHLLEKYFGCRKFSPTVEVFPMRNTLTLDPVHDTENPVNDFRVINGEFSRDLDYRDWRRLDVTDDMFATGYYVHTLGLKV